MPEHGFRLKILLAELAHRMHFMRSCNSGENLSCRLRGIWWKTLYVLDFAITTRIRLNLASPTFKNGFQATDFCKGRSGQELFKFVQNVSHKSESRLSTKRPSRTIAMPIFNFFSAPAARQMKNGIINVRNTRPNSAKSNR